MQYKIEKQVLVKTREEGREVARHHNVKEAFTVEGDRMYSKRKTQVSAAIEYRLFGCSRQMRRL